MQPHHGCEEVHLGRWKGMESNNSGELHNTLNQTQQVRGFGRQVQQQRENKKNRKEQTLTRANQTLYHRKEAL